MSTVVHPFLLLNPLQLWGHIKIYPFSITGHLFMFLVVLMNIISKTLGKDICVNKYFIVLRQISKSRIDKKHINVVNKWTAIYFLKNLHHSKLQTTSKDFNLYITLSKALFSPFCFSNPTYLEFSIIII